MSKKAKVTEVIVTYLKKVGVDNPEPTDSFHQMDIDILDFIEMLIELDKEFEIYIASEESEKWRTVQDAIDYVDQLITNKNN